MSKNYIKGLSIILILFVLLFAILSFNMRLATDDYFFIWDVKTHGIMQSVYLQYIQWCGRYFAVFLYDVVYWLFDSHQIYYSVLVLFIFLFLIGGIYRLLLSVINHFDFKMETTNRWFATLSFTALLFFLTISTGETWFWFCSMSSYLWSVIVFIWGLSFLLHKKNNIITYSGIVLCFVYCGGASEVYSIVYGFLLFILIIYQWKKKKNIPSFIKMVFNKKLVIGLLSLGFSFIIVLIAKGNYSRAVQFPNPTFMNTVSLTGRMLLKLFGWFLPQKVIYIFIFLVPFLLIGNSYNSGGRINVFLFFKKFKDTGIFLLLSVLMVFGSIAIIMSQSGEYRVWFIVSFLLAVYTVCIAFFAGKWGLFNEKQIRLLERISIPIGLIAMIITVYSQYQITEKYAASYDERVSNLVQLNTKLEKDTVIILKPLSPSGMLYSSEITNDTFHFSNRELRLGLNLKYHIIVENKKE